nr:unnamed protein product [Callosobruchus analis]
MNANNENTDEDSGDEDDVILDNLPGSQLLAEAEVLHDTTAADTEVSADGFDSEDDLPLSTFGTRVVESKVAKKSRNYKWNNRDIESDILAFVPPYGPKWLYTPLEAFFLFFDNEVIGILVQYPNMYASSHNCVGDITEDEICCFLGVLLLSGYSPHPRRSMYWENCRDTHNVLVSEAISRNRFNFIMQNIHCCNNADLPANDKFAKLRPLFDILDKKFINMSPYEESHAIDESMVPYFGHHGSKQFIRGKPIRWGYKLWVGSTVAGYIEWFEPYQGLTTVLSDKYKELGLGATVVLKFAEVLQKEFSQAVPFHLFFDNFFTSLHLLEELRIMGLKGTGTIRENRVGKACPLSRSTEMRKKERGAIEFVSSDTNTISLCKWHDNSVVAIASNHTKILPTLPVKRFCRKEKNDLCSATTCNKNV